MICKENGEKYNHFYYCEDGNEVVLLGVDKAIEEEELGIFVDCPLQVYDGLAVEIFKLKNLKDRAVVQEAIDNFKETEKQDFHGLYWRIFLDFLNLEKGITPYRLSIMLGDTISKEIFPKTFEGKLDEKGENIFREDMIKNINSNLDNARKSKCNPRSETSKMIELACYYMGITEGLLKTGEGTWYIFKDNDEYTLEKIYEYCGQRWRQGQEIILKDMISAITGIGADGIREIPIRIWAKENLLDEKSKKLISTLMEEMNKKEET